jgi:hypothetical protein
MSAQAWVARGWELISEAEPGSPWYLRGLELIKGEL